MKPTPSGWPRISSALYYEDAPAAIDWLCRAFGFQVRLKIEGEGGSIQHSELTYGEGVIMVGQAGLPHKPAFRQAPRSISGANTQNMMVYVDMWRPTARRLAPPAVRSFRSRRPPITVRTIGPIAVTNVKTSKVTTGGSISDCVIQNPSSDREQRTNG